MDFSICECYHSNSDPALSSIHFFLTFSLLACPNLLFSKLLFQSNSCKCTGICLFTAEPGVFVRQRNKNRANLKLLLRAKLMGFFHYTLLLLLFTQKYSKCERQKKETDAPYTTSLIYSDSFIIF